MKKQFPIRLRRGSVEVKIYLQVKNGYCSFTLRYYENAKSVRRTFSDLQEVREQANTVLDRLTRCEEGTLILSGSDRFNYIHTTETLRQHGLDMVNVVIVAVQVHQLLAGEATPLEAVRYFKKHNSEHINGMVGGTKLRLMRSGAGLLCPGHCRSAGLVVHQP